MESSKVLQQRHPYLDSSDTAVSVVSRVKEIKICAQWDGVQEHPAVVSVNYIIEGQPATSLGLISTTNPSTASHFIHASVHEWIEDSVKISESNKSHSKELSGETLTPSEAGEFLQVSEEEQFCEREYLPCGRKALMKVKTDDACESLSTNSSPILSHDIPKHDHFTLRAIKIATDLSERDVCSSSSTFSRSPTSNGENAGYIPSKSLSSLQPVDASSPTVGVWPVKVSRRTSTKERRHLRGITAYKRARSLETPTRQPRKPATDPRSSDLFTPTTSINVTLAQIPVATASETRLSVAACPSHETCDYRGQRPMSVPLIERPLTGSHEHIKNLQLSSVVPEVTLSSIIGCHPVHELYTPGPALSGRQKPVQLPACLASPNDSPKSWLGRRLRSAIWFSDGRRAQKDSASSPSDKFSEEQIAVDVKPPLTSITPDASLPIAIAPDEFSELPPATVILDERIFVCFPKAMATGIYEAQLEMELFLTKPDALGWQSFSLPSLLAEGWGDVEGLIEFSILSHFASGAPAQFDLANCITIQDMQERSLKGSFSIREPLLLRTRLQVEVHHLENWSGAVEIHSSMRDGQDFAMNFKHTARIFIEHLQENVFAKRFIFAMFIKNGPPNAELYRLESGQCLLQLPEYVSSESNEMVEIQIQRSFCDFDKPLELEFTCRYPAFKEASIPLPVVSSKLGKVFPGKIWVLKPSPPLQLHAVSRQFLSVWDISKQTTSDQELVCFNQVKLPILYPKGLADDAVVRVRRLTRVVFNGVPGSMEDIMYNKGPCNVISWLRMVVDVLPGKGLECRMSFTLEVGSLQRLLQIDAPGWKLNYATLNDHLCTTQNAQWWRKDLQMSLFKDSSMVLGDTIHVKLFFMANINFDDFEFMERRGDWVEACYSLPRLTDKTILAGILKCSYNEAVIGIAHNAPVGCDYERNHFSKANGEDRKPLPLMRRGYQLHLNWWMLNSHSMDQSKPTESHNKAERVQFCGGLPLSSRIVRFEDESSDTSNDGDDEHDESDAPSISLDNKPHQVARRTNPENVRLAGADKPQSYGKYAMDSSSPGHLSPGTPSRVIIDRKHYSRPDWGSAPTSTLDSVDAAGLGVAGEKINMKAGDTAGRNSQKVSENGLLVITDLDRPGTVGGDIPSVIVEDAHNDNNGRGSAAGQDTSDSSDDRDSDAAGQDISESEDGDADAGAAMLEWVEELLDFLMDFGERILFYLGRRSPSRYLLRFLILACIAYLGMPWVYFDEEPAQMRREAYLDLFTKPASILLGDLDVRGQPTSVATPQGTPLVSGTAEDISTSLEQGSEPDIVEVPHGQSLRDRIDLALGWRPIP